jgi:hypothetical protein
MIGNSPNKKGLFGPGTLLRRGEKYHFIYIRKMPARVQVIARAIAKTTQDMMDRLYMSSTPPLNIRLTSSKDDNNGGIVLIYLLVVESRNPTNV